MYEWLSDEQNGSWLMVLDNADDKSVFSNKKREITSQEGNSDDDALNLLSYLPQTPNGSILITSRNRDAAYRLISSTRNIIDVPLMDAELAVSLSSKKLPRNQQSLDRQLELVELLDRLPLAITQASAFISMRNLSLADYMKYFRENTAILLEDMGDIRRDPTMRHSVILTWHISFNQIKKDNKQAADLLSLMSVLERQDIPRFLVRGEHSDLSFDNAIAPLLDFSLISQDESRKAFAMHRLVQIATRTWLEKHNEKGAWEGTAVALLAGVFPMGDYDNREICACLLPHANVLADYQYKSPQDELSLRCLLCRRAWYLFTEGRFHLAKEDAQRVLDMRLGSNSSVLNAMGVMAAVLEFEGDYLTAEGHYREILIIGQQIGLFADVSELENAGINLGICLIHQGKYEEAMQIIQNTYESREKRLGKRDTLTLDAMGHLANALRCQKKFDEAEDLCQQRLDILRQIKGQNHPLTVGCIGGMALILSDHGKHERAVELSRHASELTRNKFGSEHPKFLGICRILQTSLLMNGQLDEAEDLARHMLTVRDQSPGLFPIHTLNSVHKLANTLVHRQKYEESEKLQRRALSDGEKFLGKEHLDTMDYRRDLIACLEIFYNKHEEAGEMLQTLEVEGRQKEADEIRAEIEERKTVLKGAPA